MSLICTPHMANRPDWKILLAGTSSRREGSIPKRRACPSGQCQELELPQQVCKLSTQWASGKETPQWSLGRLVGLQHSVMCRRILLLWGKDGKRLFSFMALRFPGWEKPQTGVAQNPCLTFLAKCQCALLNFNQTCQLVGAQDIMAFPAT